MPDHTSFDLDFRPKSYWSGPERTYANIKGEARRREVLAAVETGTVDRLPEGFAADELTDAERDVLGKAHPMFMGGEYLPSYDDDEVEIARVSLKSTTADVISIRAVPDGDAIRYRIVDEYETDFELAHERSLRPLSLGELVDTIELGCPPSSYREMNCSDDSDAAGLEDFVTVSSVFYPELQSWYEAEAEEWVASKAGRVHP